MIVSGAVRSIVDRGVGEVTRRVEVFESDGVTPWNQDFSDRLVDGSVNITYGNNERRGLDVTLKNTDNVLRSQPNGFWYDKVIKIYRGVNYNSFEFKPRILVLDRTGGRAEADKFIALIGALGLPNAEYILTPPDVSELMDYDVVISYTGATATAHAAKLKTLYEAGKKIITIGQANGTTHLPFVTTTASITQTWGIQQTGATGTLVEGWTSETAAGGASSAAAAITVLGGGAQAVARWPRVGGGFVFTGTVASNGAGGRWFDLHLNTLAGTQTLILFANAIKWIKEDPSFSSWEAQLGEFCIDGINSDYFPSHVKVTGRDYTKRAMNSKVETAVAFVPGTSVYTIVHALGVNAGLTKFRLAAMPEVLATTITFDRGTPRWDIMRQAAETHGYEIFLDAQGFLCTRKFIDPTTGLIANTFQTGSSGNLAGLGRSVNDSRIYNNICVYGDPSSGETRMPYFGQAKNTEVSSPTRIEKIGDRFFSFASTFFTNQLQTEEYAQRLLKIHALESFEMSLSGITYPWMEVGEVGKIVDPKAVATDPDRYLIDSCTVPLTLGPMSFTGKRITIVG